MNFIELQYGFHQNANVSLIRRNSRRAASPPVKKFGGIGEGVRGRGKETLFKGALSPPPILPLYNLILLTGWIEISGVTSWYETTGRP